MNLIVCDQNCRHQQEGYCTLNCITRLTRDTRAKCGYYEDVNFVEEIGRPAEPPAGDFH